MARYPQAILVSCPVPWTSEQEVDEPLFRRLVRRCLDEGFRHVYVFGTGGEGYAVDTRRFEQVARIFGEETRSGDVHAMVGVIGLSTAAVLERIELAHSLGFRTFQISLPSWGPLTDREVMTFFSDVCGACEDSRFLHYNLPRARRVLTGSDYRRLVDAIPNLVATKTTSGGLSLAADLMRNAPELQHFMGEGNFPHGCMYGECSLLASYAELTPERTRQLFKAGREGRVEELFRLQHDFQAMSDGLWAQVAPGPHMDGAFDKMLVKLGFLQEFPLRLLSPYESLTDADYQACRRFLVAHHPGWLSGQQEVR